MAELITKEKQKTREETLKVLFPKILYERYRFIEDPLMYIIVDDVIAEELTSLKEENSIEVLSLNDLIEELLPTLRTLLAGYSFEEVLMVYPGGGGYRVQTCIPQDILTTYTQLNIDVHRIKNSHTGVREPTMDEIEQKKLYENLRNKKLVIVLDDAINGGNTLRYIRSIGNDDASWVSVSPIIFSPLPQQDTRLPPSSIYGYDVLIGTEVLEGVTNPVPLNFISSLMAKSPESILSKFPKPEEAEDFINILRTIRSKYMV